ncbi:MAG: 30S ribosomal protein S8e [Candidatus Nitrosopelagicus sp.]|nr:30S ribosomal protein S8e [Candidatus Nitrosopelagicus sp.]NWJ89928.1 30S ribosomal protein S8e [Marine Group I thaumarchaeote]PXF28357.1 MAG: 30S ribosomal protein S8e [Nitrososphaerota archaeon]HIC06037.1 30S ribosomal protein S8e [Candidatus Nitrosopelagicus sp.]HIO85003.1 30S ribosomal protein S8e [Candidatus Nitrosopelagicus sp.]
MKKSMENLSTSKITGGRRHPLRSRRKYEMNRFPNEALLGEPVMVTRKVRGKNIKTALKTVNFVNLAVDSNVKKVKILKVLENATNNDYQRRGVISKGAILETAEGKCRVVSRPGQHGVVNAILVK